MRHLLSHNYDALEVQALAAFILLPLCVCFFFNSALSLLASSLIFFCSTCCKGQIHKYERIYFPNISYGLFVLFVLTVP